MKISKLLNEQNRVNSMENQRRTKSLSSTYQCSNGGQLIKDASQNALPIIYDYWLEVIAHGKVILNPKIELSNNHISLKASLCSQNHQAYKLSSPTA